MRRRFFGLCCIAAIAATQAAGASGATLTVTTTFDSLIPGDGLCSLREAIATAEAPQVPTDCGTADSGANTIVLGAHEYRLTIPRSGPDDNSSGDLNVSGPPGELTVAGAGAKSTEISAAGLGDRVLSVAFGQTVALRELTISGGHAPNGTDQPPAAHNEGAAGGTGANGGGILNAGSLSLLDAAVSANVAGRGGSGGTGAETMPFLGMSGAGGPGGAGGSGGGIYNTGLLKLSDSTVTGNTAGSGGSGGTGGREGGGPAGPGGSGGCCGNGGGISNVGGSVFVSGSTISFNRAGDGGNGGFGGEGYEGNSSTEAEVGGTAAGGASGGGIASAGGSLSITNSTIASNISGLGGDGGPGGNDLIEGPGPAGGGAGNGSAGGALFVKAGGTATLVNVTVYANQVGGPGTPGAGGKTPGDTEDGPAGPAGAAAFGGGIYASGGTITATNTLLSTNELGNCAGSVTDGGHDLSFGTSGCPAGFAGGDPKLGALGDNGGPTGTMALGAGSAAIDQVPATGASCPTDDQRGVPRPSGSGCDIGAYEVAPPAVSLGSVDSVTATGATLTGSASPNAGSAEVHFEYGTTASYGSTTPAQSLPSGVQPGPVSASLSGLQPRTVYHYRLLATSQDGAATSSDATFETGAPGRTGAANGPRLSGLTVNPSRFHTRKRGTTINYADSLAARTTFVVFSVRHGAERGGHCASARRSLGGKLCKRLVKLGSFTHADQAGINTLHFNGLVGSRTLRPGRYRLEATASLDGVTGNTISAPFRVA